MGLKDLVDESVPTQTDKYRQYPVHPEEDKFNDWMEEFQERFPTEVEIDFIEISPEMTKTLARSYTKSRDGELTTYIRIAEKTLELDEWYQRQVLLNIMTQKWLRQMGANHLGAGHAIKKWVSGRVGCIINAVDADSEEWRLLAEPFLEDDMKR